MQSGCKYISKVQGRKHLRVWFSHRVGESGGCVFSLGEPSFAGVSTGFAYEPQVFNGAQFSAPSLGTDRKLGKGKQSHSEIFGFLRQAVCASGFQQGVWQALNSLK